MVAAARSGDHPPAGLSPRPIRRPASYDRQRWSSAAPPAPAADSGRRADDARDPAHPRPSAVPAHRRTPRGERRGAPVRGRADSDGALRPGWAQGRDEHGERAAWARRGGRFRLGYSSSQARPGAGERGTRRLAADGGVQGQVGGGARNRPRHERRRPRTRGVAAAVGS